LEQAGFRSLYPPLVVASVLATTAQDLYCGGDLRSIADLGSPKHAVTADVNQPADLGLRVCNE